MAVNQINSDATTAPTGLLKDRQAIISGGFGLSSRPSLRCMALRAERLAAFRAERPVFREVGFAISAGGALLLLGPNGSGKSTLLRLLAGLKQPDAGTITWYGKNIATDPRAHAARVAYVGHLDAVKPGLTAAENLACDARLGGGNTEVALAALDLTPLAALPARMLSAGQRRRLALARLALIPAPLWLLDEPTIGLDAAAIDKFGAILAAHRAGGGVIVAATHVALPVPGAAELRLG